jgi:circadian clock protein KaiC
MTPAIINDPERISTGNVQADEILAGGFVANSINIIMGQPGTGKTAFAESMVFHNADGSRPILYLTTLSEPMTKVLAYLQGFSFCDPGKIGTQVLYEDIGAQLAKDGIGALVPIIKQAVRTITPKIIVIDSFKALHDLAPSVLEMRKILYELTGELTAYATSVFLVGEYSDDDVRTQPEFAIADGIIQFLRSPLSTRDERFMRVLKLRGSRYLEGLHGFKIKSSGLEIYPRLVTPEIPEAYEIKEERLHWGIPGMDKLFNGGLWRGSTTLLAGATGSGKTTIALQFAIEGITQSEPSLYINFQENPTQLARSVRSLGANLKDVQAKGFHLMYISPVEMQIDSVIVTLFRHAREHKIRRIVVDAVGDLLSAASDRQRLHDYLYTMVQHFNVNGISSLLLLETLGELSSGARLGDHEAKFSYMSDNIVFLSIDVNDKIKRRLSVLKARGTAQDLDVHEFEITAKGAAILGSVKRDSGK